MIWYIVAAIPVILILRRMLRRKILSKPDLDPPVVQTKNGKVSIFKLYLDPGVQTKNGKVSIYKLYQDPGVQTRTQLPIYLSLTTYIPNYLSHHISVIYLSNRNPSNS